MKYLFQSPPPNEQLAEMKRYAKLHHIPIMEEEGLHTLIGLLRLQQPRTLLELGSAIGYSAIRLAEALPHVSIVTIERDDVRYEEAVSNIERSGYGDRITIYHADALEFDEVPFHKTFDALFIDAAKGQYERFFNKYEPTLTARGVVYCDNMLMDGQTLQPLEHIPRRNRTMIRNLQQFMHNMATDDRFHVSFFRIGDGMMIAKKKEETT